MISGLIGRKLGMSQLFDKEGNVVPVTLIKAGPCVITQIKTIQKDGYQAVQIGMIEKISEKRMNKCLRNHLKKAGSVPVKKLVEVEAKSIDGLKLGDKVTAADIFAENDMVSVTGNTKGKGFQGVIKRHRFSGGPDTHGSKTHRVPGSIGSSSFPSRVFKGKRMGGRMGGKRQTIKNLRIVKIDAENNIIAIKGCIPGYNGAYVVINKNL